MTVSTTDSVVEYVSGGPAFPIPYRFLQDSDIEAVLVKQDGSTETLTGAQYTLSGAGSQNGGTLTSSYAAGFLGVAGASLTISRVMDPVQPTDLRNQGKFLAETHETVFDRLTMLIQQGFSILRRALLRPIGKNYYDAEGRQIKRLADPTEAQDATTMKWTGDFLSNIQGPINNSANVLYQFPDGSPHVVQDLSSTIGSDGIGHESGTVGDALRSQGAEVQNLYRAGKTGIFTSSAYIPTIRSGPLAYRKHVGGGAELLTDLSRFMPAGAKRTSTAKRQVFAQVTVGPFTTTGTPDVHRYILAGHTLWGTPGGELLQASVINNVTGRKYLDARLYPGADYSATVLNSAGFGGLTVEIKQPAGVAAPSSLVVELGYDTGTDTRAIYVDPINGFDTYDGGSPAWPMKTIPAAIAKNPEVIWLKPSIYTQTNYPGAYTSANDIAIRSLGGRSYFVSMATSFSAWTLVSGTVYVTTVGGSPTPVGCVDLTHFDEFGVPRILTPVASLAECQATPNSFFYEAGPRKMNVNLIDGSVPDNAKVTPYGAGNTFRHSSATAKVYLSDIDFIGGTGGAISARDAGINGVLITERCRFLGNYNSNGADIKDVGLYIGIDCLAAYNNGDGFNYTAFNGFSPHFIELGCFGYRNFGTGTSNGTTAHDDCVGFRINVDSAFNAGPGVGDVGNANTLSVNITSRKNGPNANAAGFAADGAGAKMYLDGASADGNASQDFRATNGAVIYARDFYYQTLLGDVQPMV
ncbi:hypothetical protein D3C79_587600 [compost metagenome]